MFWQSAVGSTLSSIVTSAVQTEVFPFESVTVSVTVLTPRSSQSKVDGLGASVTEPQLSVEPPSTSADTIVAFPVASNCTVMS